MTLNSFIAQNDKNLMSKSVGQPYILTIKYGLQPNDKTIVREKDKQTNR